MKNWYVVSFMFDTNVYCTNLCTTDSKEQAEEHFNKYDMSTVRIAAEDEIYYLRSKGCPVVEL